MDQSAPPGTAVRTERTRNAAQGGVCRTVPRIRRDATRAGARTGGPVGVRPNGAPAPCPLWTPRAPALLVFGRLTRRAVHGNGANARNQVPQIAHRRAR